MSSADVSPPGSASCQREPVAVSSPGQAFTSSDSLDEHFALNQPEYQAMCHAVAIQPGWHVQTSPYDLPRIHAVEAARIPMN